MSNQDYIFSSESVTEGHPDKVADQISDAVLDDILAQDPQGRVACECMVSTGFAFVSGEITTKCYTDIPTIVRNTIRDIGYVNADMGFHWETCAVITSIGRQSPDIALGVDGVATGLQGAGDQGIMFGYACRETPELMPLPIQCAHDLTKALARTRRAKGLPFLRPDGKSQVSVLYSNHQPVEINNVVISTQHTPDVSQAELREGIISEIIEKTLPTNLLTKRTVFHINPTGRFVVGGPMGDCGLTGRKIIVDTYGGAGHHGGGCFSGKDPSKVDRSAAYMARYIAKNIVASGVADRCEVQLAYAIGVADPVSVMIETYGTGKVDERRLSVVVRELFPLRPAEIITHLDLLRPIYRKTAAYGHFGRKDSDFTWERTDKASDLRAAF
ncbi:MAG: methionine adenosyltransferase [Deltaproteobacteria bacterium RIFOXYA12_FULL_61_11]|nr:MAG: methionine adenosyltransferase [Deltaproteobacteria bacterium RIFOXYA12_FULL_61_11]